MMNRRLFFGSVGGFWVGLKKALSFSPAASAGQPTCKRYLLEHDGMNQFPAYDASGMLAGGVQYWIGKEVDGVPVGCEMKQVNLCGLGPDSSKGKIEEFFLSHPDFQLPIRPLRDFTGEKSRQVFA